MSSPSKDLIYELCGKNQNKVEYFGLTFNSFANSDLFKPSTKKAYTHRHSHSDQYMPAKNIPLIKNTEPIDKDIYLTTSINSLSTQASSSVVPMTSLLSSSKQPISKAPKSKSRIRLRCTEKFPSDFFQPVRAAAEENQSEYQSSVDQSTKCSPSLKAGSDECINKIMREIDMKVGRKKGPRRKAAKRMDNNNK